MPDEDMPRATRRFKRVAYGYLAELGKALASPARVELLELLAQAPRSVEALAADIDQSVANTSHHLQALKRAQLVTGTRDGARVVYALARDEVAALVAQLHTTAAAQLDALAALTHGFFAARDALEPIDLETLLARLRAGEAMLVDVRPSHEYAAGHLPGAMSAPLAELDDRLGSLARDRTIVAYCRGPFCSYSADAVRRLRALGFDAQRTSLSVHDRAGFTALAAEVGG